MAEEMIFTISTLYTRLRRRARALLLDYPALDRVVGRTLARIDGRIQMRGALRSFDERGVVECHGFTFHFRPMDAPTTRVMFLNGDYEPATREALLTLLPSGGTFVDLGAHIGYFSLLAARHIGSKGRVFAFEPMDGTRAVLEQNLKVNGLSSTVEVVPLASSDHEGVVRFVVTDTSESSGIAGIDEQLPTIEVATTSLDAFFRARAWPRVDVIKMDVEGAELATLRGMAELCRRNPKLALIFEYHLAQMEHASVDPDAILDIIRSYGFDRFEVLFRERTPIELPRDRGKLEAMARRANLNLLCRKDAA